MDNISKKQRSWNMSRIRSINTKPEIIVRSFLHRSGFRFRLHVKSLPGSPDIVLSRYRTAIFVHGCFWHRHSGCKFAYTPKSRIDFWNNKFMKNIERDKLKTIKLIELGWQVITVWECETKDVDNLTRSLQSLIMKHGGYNGRNPATAKSCCSF